MRRGGVLLGGLQDVTRRALRRVWAALASGRRVPALRAGWQAGALARPGGRRRTVKILTVSAKLPAMTNLQRLTIRASEIRQRLNECSGLTGDALTTEIRSEVDTLTTEYTDTEVKLRAAIVADDGTQHRGAADDAEARELAALTGRASIGRIVSGVVERRAVDGADLELQQHHGLPAERDPARPVARAGRRGRAAQRDTDAGERGRDAGGSDRASLRDGQRRVSRRSTGPPSRTARPSTRCSPRGRPFTGR